MRISDWSSDVCSSDLSHKTFMFSQFLHVCQEERGSEAPKGKKIYLWCPLTAPSRGCCELWVCLELRGLHFQDGWRRGVPRQLEERRQVEDVAVGVTAVRGDVCVGFGLGWIDVSGFLV